MLDVFSSPVADATTGLCESMFRDATVGHHTPVSFNGIEDSAELYCIERTDNPNRSVTLTFDLFVHGVSVKEIKAICSPNKKWIFQW